MVDPAAKEDLVTRLGLVCLTLVVAIQTARSADHQVGDEPAARREGAAILRRVEQANAVRDASLESYLSTRRYSVFEPGHETDAELRVSMQFVAPATKTFTTLEVRGVGWIDRRVFKRLLAAETEAASGKDKTDSAISPANYDAQLVGTDRLSGRECYILALTPKRHDKYLFVGKAWIDTEDVAIARVEGEPAKSPSFWVVRAPFVREYERVDSFWLPRQDETHTEIRFAGPYVLRIQYADYKITARR
jgi:hypothetical protein